MKFRPAASMRTMASPSLGCGAGMSSSWRTSGPPRLWMRIAFMPRSLAQLVHQHPLAAQLCEAVGVLGREGFAAEALDVLRRGTGLTQPEADGAHQGVAVPATEDDADFWIEGSHAALSIYITTEERKTFHPPVFWGG